MMNNDKLNDMLLETLANPSAKAYDFLSNGITAENTQILDKEEYKRKQTIQDQFKLSDGKFDEIGFNQAYQVALHNYNQISNEELVKKMDQVEYDPFDLTRPKNARTWSVDVKFSQDINPFKQLYSRDSINSITESNLSLREIAQQGRIHDLETNTWSESVNKSGLFTKLFGDTLVYAQWDEDGVHQDPINGHLVNHKKGDWKIDDTGSLYLEKLGNREIYGKQVVNPSDILTTDGSVFNKFDFFDSDGREKSIGKTAMKTIAEIAPLLIPGVNTWYGGTRAAIGLATVMPTFYKSIEGWLLGDNKSILTDPVTKAEGWLAKFNQTSSSDRGSEGFWNFEQMSSMVTDIFSQIYEQRAMASLSKYLMRPDKLLDQRVAEMQMKAIEKSLPLAKKNNINIADAVKKVISESPDIQAAFKRQSQLSKALSLGYMALTSTGDVYGEAIESGYDRRTAGFASILTAAGQYGIMMNNRMGDWFLDKTTGYNVNVNRALMSKSVKPWLAEIDEVLKSPNSTAIKRSKLAEITRKVKRGMDNVFSEPSILGEAMFKNMIVEGIEEVTEQVVQDATKAMVDVMNYLGLTKGKGDFRTIERYATGEAFQEYLANFVGGVLGGGLFELERSRISPWMLNRGKISPEIRKNVYELVANGHKDDLIREIQRQSKYLTDSTLSYIDENGEYKPSTSGESQADLVATKAIEIIEALDNTFNRDGTNLTDDEIINKALRNQIILTEFDKYKPENKHVGLEGLMLEDFKTNALKISEIRDKIVELEKQPGTEEQVKTLKEDLNPLIQKRNDILNGDYAMKYFDQLAVVLNPEIKELFGSLDKSTFVKAKYNKDYINLPDSGEGITKELVDKEWQDFLDSTDMIAKIEFITNAYKSLEATLNPTIANYVNSGYDILRKQVFDKIIDLNTTIQLFNTAESPETKSNLIQNFIKINNDLEQLGLLKVTPWDVINYDGFDNIFKQGLIKKSVNGELQDYSTTELNSVQSNGKTLLENLREDFNTYSKLFPTNPLNTQEVIDNFNSHIQNINANIDQQVAKLRATGSTDPEVLQQLVNLENSYKNVQIDSLNNAPVIKTEIQRVQDEINIAIGNATSSREEYDKFVELQNNPAYSKDFNTLLKEVNFDAQSISDLSKEQFSTLVTLLNSLGLWQTVKNYFQGKEAEQIIQRIENGEINLQEAEEIFKFVADEINSGYTLLQNSDLQNAFNFSINKQVELESFIEENRPEFFQIKNVAFDFILNAITTEGLNDAELYNQLKDMFNQALEQYTKSVLPGFEVISNEDITWILNNIDLFIEQVSELSFEYNNYMNKGDGSLRAIENDLNNFQNIDFLKELIFKNFYLDSQVSEILEPLDDFYEVHTNLMKSDNIIEKFLNFEQNKGVMKSNPLYDFIRNFSLTLNSNPENKVNKIFDILENEERMFRASSGASNFISDDIRESDINQAINTLEMISAVVNAMSTTSYYDGDLTGFIAMRQQYAKNAGIDDDVLKLQLLNSDQAGTMIGDLNKIIVKLQFMKDLSLVNSVKMAAEHEIIRNNMNLINYSLFENIAKNAKLSQFIPKDFETILESKDEPEKKLLELEESFYRHNKNNKIEALEAILRYEYSDAQNQRVDVDNRNNITKDTHRGEITPYTKIIYLTTVLGSSSKDFQKQYLDTLENRLDKAPFYMQELVSRIIKVTTAYPELFAKIYELRPNLNNDDAHFLTIVLGGAGTGKTTAVTATVLDILRQTNDSSKIWLAAPNKDQAAKFHSDVVNSIGKELISFNELDKQNLFSQFGSEIEQLWQNIDSAQKDIANNHGNGKLFTFENDGQDLIFRLPDNWDSGLDYNLLPNLLVIDEVTHFSAAELILLNAISEKSFKSGNFMKVVGLGDQNQMGFNITDNRNKGKTTFNYNVNALNSTFTPTLMTSVRATNDQKRINNDFVLGLVNESIKIFNKYNLQPSLKPKEVTNKSNLEFKNEFLNNIKHNIGLKYYLKNNDFKGDYIQTNESDLSAITAIKNSLRSASESGNPLKLGILTRNGKLDPIIDKLLTSVGLTEDEYTIYTINNIQGSESDYFIFNSDLINSFDKTRDFIRSFYTYLSRSKIGTIVLDTNNVLKSELNLENAVKSQYFIPYEPLTKSVIDNIKGSRIDKIKSLLGEYQLSNDKFKWQSLEVDEESSENVEGIIDNDTLDFIVKTYGNSEKKHNITIDEFKPMLHGFYNNLNAIYENGIITTSNVNTPTDLNGYKNSDDPEVSRKILNQWGKLKSKLLFSRNIKSISGNDYQNYFKHIFRSYDSSKPVNVELKLTLSKYNPLVNQPYLKFGQDQSEQLSEKDPFVNLSAKLSFGGKSHYITLATLGRHQTILNAIANISEEGLNNEQRLELQNSKKSLVTKINNTFAIIKDRLSKLNSNEIDDLINLVGSDIEIITSTRLVPTENPSKQRNNFKLTELSSKFPGLNISELRFYPNNFQRFKSLYNLYKFGSEIPDTKLQELFDKLKNKPYVVVSYNNDLNGNNGNDVSAKLVPVLAESRDIKVLQREITDLYDEYTKKIQEFYAKPENKDKPMNFDDSLDAKFQTMLGKPELLKILIHWGQIKDNNGQSMLDLFTREIPGDTPTSILDTLNRFKGSTVTSDKVEQVIEIVKSEISKGGSNSEILDRVRRKTDGITAWHKSFYNFFIDKKLIKDRKLMKDNSITDEQFDLVENGINELISFLGDFKFYYSLPIQTINQVNTINRFVDGKSGFTNNFFHNKFYISITPEPPRLLVNNDKFLKISNQIPPTKDSKKAKTKQEPIPNEIYSSSFNGDAFVIGDPNAITGNFKIHSIKDGKGLVSLNTTFEELKNIYHKLGRSVEFNGDINSAEDIIKIIDGTVEKDLSTGRWNLISPMKVELKYPPKPTTIDNILYTTIRVAGNDVQPLARFDEMITLLQQNGLIEIAEGILDIARNTNISEDSRDTVNNFLANMGIGTESNGTYTLKNILKSPLIKALPKGDLKIQINNNILKKIVEDLNECK